VSKGALWTPSEAEKRIEVPDGFDVKGRVRMRIWDELGLLKYDHESPNVITQVGRQFLVKRALAIATIPDLPSGAKLGQGTTAESTTGAGAHIVTYISTSQKAIDGSFPTEAAQGVGSRATFQITWAAGGIAASNVNEVIITNQNPLADNAGLTANTLARAVVPVANKLLADTLVVGWTWDIGIS
jgi:hypothetical protein